MQQSMNEVRQQRLQKFYADCQQQVISQIIGPFGLSTAMFEDRNGGNVTTTHNFEQGIVATEADQKKYDEWQERKETNWQDRRKPYDRNSKPIRDNNKKPDAPDIKSGYTGNMLNKDKHAHLEHITSVKEIETDAGNDLRMTLEERVALANSSQNTTYIEDVINTSGAGGKHPAKNHKDLMNYYNSLSDEQKCELGIKEKLVKEQYNKSKHHIAKEKTKSWLKKDGEEILTTGTTQAARMGLRQALGVLLAELVNALFNEILALIKHGVEFGKSLFEEIRERLGRIVESIAKKLPDAVSQMFEGGVSGFMSNLLTFLLNNFLTTAKRFVTAIREGLLGLFKAFKMIFFPPENMTQQEAMQAGLKILTAVVISTVGILLQETIATFMATLPFLKPFADIVTPILIGTMTGMLSAFLAYQIDCIFDRLLNNERQLDELIADAKRRDKFANELVKLSNSSLENVSNYAKSIAIYQSIGNTLGAAGLAANATLHSLETTVAETSEQVAKSLEAIVLVNSGQSAA